MSDNVIFVFDKFEYKKNEKYYLSVLKEKFNDVRFEYTEYEDWFIRKVRNLKGIGSALQHISYWLKSYNYARKIFKLNSKNIICINPIVGIFLGLFNRKKNKNIILCGFLFEQKQNTMYYKARVGFVKKALLGIDTAVVYAEQEVDYYERILGIRNKFKFIKYGIDYDADDIYQGNLPSEYLFSGGGSDRDYKTLIEAYHHIPQDERPKLCIATNPKCLVGLDTSDITVLTDVVLETFGNVMGRSMCLILSLKDTDISAGHQVLLQGLSRGVPIIVNDIRAIRDYVTDENVIFYKSGDTEQLAKTIMKVYAEIDQESKRSKKNVMLYNEEYTFVNLLQRLLMMEERDGYNSKI